MKARRPVLTLLCLLTSVLLSLPTTISAQLERFKTTTCEQNIALLEAAHKRSNEPAKLILIARLGVSERSSIVNRQRLYNAVAYLTEYNSLRPRSSIVVGEGQRNRESTHGLIEIYVTGKLFGTLSVPEKSNLRVGSCEPEEMDSPEQRRKRSLFFPSVDPSVILNEW